jgi:tetratricopeptide (TPR) repeat protein
MLKHNYLKGIAFIFMLSIGNTAKAQPAWTFDIFGKEKKPEKYEEKLLPSEKTANKKNTLPRRFVANTTSHYNFFFNANNRLNAVVERASISNKDDYAKLLAFYPYSLDNTASQKTELDSVIYKATSGILLHDLRSEWVDNFYLLIGKSYFLKKDFDSAALTFQFINYNLFPRKKKNDDDNRIVGSNDNGTATVGAVSIANKEKRNIVSKVFTRPPSRNDALIWLTRTFILQNELGDAAGLISILQNDPNLPKRLQNDLQEVTSYWFFAQNNYDSAAVHLEKALSNADTRADRSRWEFLLAQMYEMSGKFDDAEKFYAKASKSTNDPLMDIYARLNSAKMMRSDANPKELDNSIATLLRMARKDKFDAYKDILYFSAAQLSLKKGDTTAGIGLFAKSIANNITASIYRDKSFLQLADIAYAQKRYTDAHSFYDSVNLSTPKLDIDSALVVNRKEILGRLVPYILSIQREDSVQRIALLSPAEREVYVKKLAKKYRKENGLKEEEFIDNDPIVFANNSNKPVDIFQTSNPSGQQWYFYNASLRSKGFSDFKAKWGKRANIDNWRRKSLSQSQISNTVKNGAPTATPGSVPTDNLDPDAPGTKEETLAAAGAAKAIDFSFDGLMGGLPLTKEKLDTSNILIAKNLLAVAQIFQNELQDYEQAIETYINFEKRFPTDEKLSDVYAGLSFCYLKLGNQAKSDLYKNLVRNKFSSSNAAKLIANPLALTPNAKSPEVTAIYEKVYNLFLEGKFEEAIVIKQKTDSTYGKNYWSPQLLYIEAVHYIKERKDSNAIVSLKNIVNLYPKSALKPKAETLMDVLDRRVIIEKYLTDLQVTRAEEEQIIIADDKPIVKVAAPIVKPAEVKAIAPPIAKKMTSDSIKAPAVFVNKAFTLQPDQPHKVVMILDKVDGVYINEAKNAFVRYNKESMATINVVIAKDTLDATKNLLVFASFENADAALKYFDRIKKAAPIEVSWLQASKYSFIIISENNLQLLKTNKDLKSYKELINLNFGNRF